MNMRLGKIGWMLVVVGGVLAGCHASEIDIDDGKCAQDTDCAAGQRCEKTTGQCVGEIDDGKCAQDTDCAAGQRCEKTTGQCVAGVQGDRDLRCANSKDCLSSEICHPTAKVCVRTCGTSADCPDTAKTCGAVSAKDSTQVCHCSTGALCNQGRQKDNLVCSNLDRVCSPACALDADCGTGRMCNTGTGQCALPEPEPRTLRCQTDADCLALETLPSLGEGLRADLLGQYRLSAFLEDL